MVVSGVQNSTNATKLSSVHMVCHPVYGTQCFSDSMGLAYFL